MEIASYILILSILSILYIIYIYWFGFKLKWKWLNKSKVNDIKLWRIMILNNLFRFHFALISLGLVFYSIIVSLYGKEFLSNDDNGELLNPFMIMENSSISIKRNQDKHLTYLQVPDTSAVSNHKHVFIIDSSEGILRETNYILSDSLKSEIQLQTEIQLQSNEFLEVILSEITLFLKKLINSSVNHEFEIHILSKREGHLVFNYKKTDFRKFVSSLRNRNPFIYRQDSILPSLSKNINNIIQTRESNNLTINVISNFNNSFESTISSQKEYDDDYIDDKSIEINLINLKSKLDKRPKNYLNRFEKILRSENFGSKVYISSNFISANTPFTKITPKLCKSLIIKQKPIYLYDINNRGVYLSKNKFLKERGEINNYKISLISRDTSNYSAIKAGLVLDEEYINMSRNQNKLLTELSPNFLNNQFQFQITGSNNKWLGNLSVEIKPKDDLKSFISDLKFIKTIPPTTESALLIVSTLLASETIFLAILFSLSVILHGFFIDYNSDNTRTSDQLYNKLKSQGDLTLVKWIGPKRSEVLKKAQISTISQVSHLTERELYKILNTQNKQKISSKKIIEILKSAKELISKSKKSI